MFLCLLSGVRVAWVKEEKEQETPQMDHLAKRQAWEVFKPVRAAMYPGSLKTLQHEFSDSSIPSQPSFLSWRLFSLHVLLFQLLVRYLVKGIDQKLVLVPDSVTADITGNAPTWIENKKLPILNAWLSFREKGAGFAGPVKSESQTFQFCQVHWSRPARPTSFQVSPCLILSRY